MADRVVIRVKDRYYPPVEARDLQLIVHEVYASIQGESSYAGRPCVFVRLTGCNLRCTYCDTEYAFSSGEKRSVESVAEQVIEFGIPLVEITGGEPLLQKGCVALAEQLIGSGLVVLIETSGERPIDVLPDGAIRIMDIKCPSSGESERMNWGNIEHLKSQDEVKFVIGDRADYDWACRVMKEHDLSRRCTILISTVYDTIDPKTVVGWMLEDKLDARLQIQLHKHIWGAEERGV